MRQIRVSSRIAAPAEKVFAKATDLKRAPEFISAIKKMEILTPDPIGVGTRFRETRVMFGREATEEMQVTVFEPPRRFAIGAESNGCRFLSEFSFRSDGPATEVEMSFGAEPLTFPAKVMAFLMSPMMRSMEKVCAKELEELKSAVESGN
jgi:hypothetical protein